MSIEDMFNLEGAVVERECMVVFSIDMGVDLNASEEDTIIEEFNHILRQGEDVDLEEYGGFIPNYLEEGVYDIFTSKREMPWEDTPPMMDAIKQAMSIQGVNVSDSDITIEAREIRSLISGDLADG